MQELERMINIYHTAFIVCLVLGIVFLLITVFLFFKFDIRKIFDMKTGRGARRTIQKMEEINARTGKLRQDMVPHTPVNLRPEDRITYPVTAANPQVHAQAAAQRYNNAMGQSNAEKAVSAYGLNGYGQAGNTMETDGSAQTSQLAGDGSIQTELLGADGSQETAVLYQTSETTVLSPNMTKDIQQRKLELPGAFKIEKELISVHTKEVL